MSLKHAKTSWGESTLVTDPLKLTRPKIDQLLRLCHPDRHANSPLATEITTWLLSLRKELDKPKKIA